MATKDTRDIMPLIEEIFKHYAHIKDGDFMRELMALILNKLMDAEVSTQIGAHKYERTEERNNQRNGTRTRPYDTRLGTIDFKIPIWTEFLRRLVSRGLSGVKLVISDAHEGLKNAITEVLGGCSWQRYRVHFMRNLLCQIPRKQQGMVSAIVRTIFAAPDQKLAKDQLYTVVDQLKDRFPKAMEVLANGCESVLQYMEFPQEHWAQLHSTNPLERLNREIRRRTDVVSIFPNRQSVIRLVGSLLIEQHEEWQIGRKYFSKESMNKVVKPSIAPYTLEPVALLYK